MGFTAANYRVEGICQQAYSRIIWIRFHSIYLLLFFRLGHFVYIPPSWEGEATDEPLSSCLQIVTERRLAGMRALP